MREFRWIFEKVKGIWRKLPTPERNLFLALWAIYLLFLFPHVATTMMPANLDLTISIVDCGTLTLHPYTLTDVALREGRYYSGLPPGTAFLTVPLYVLFKPLLWLFLDEWEFQALNVLAIVFISAPASALLVSILYSLLGLFELTKRERPILAGLFAFGTPLFVTATLYDKANIGAVLVFGAFALLWKVKEQQAGAFLVFLSGLLIGAAVAVNYPLGIFLPLYFLYILSWPMRRRAALFVGGALLPLIALSYYHWAAFGSPLATSYNFRLMPTGEIENQVALVGRRLYGQALWRLLFGPGTGYFVMTPLLAVGVLGAGRSVWRGPFRAEAILALASLLILWLFFSSYFYWHQYIGLSPRHLIASVPFVFLFIGVAPGIPRSTAFRLAAGWSLLTSYIGTLPGHIPSDVQRFIYALKIAISSLGTPSLFSVDLARILPFSTLHLIVARPDVTLGDLLREGPWRMAQLLLGQLTVLAIFLAAVGVVFLAVRSLLRDTLNVDYS